MALSSHDKDIPFPIFWGENIKYFGACPIQNKGFTEFCRRINRGLWEEERGKKDRKFPHLQGIHEELMEAWEKRNYK